MIKKLKLCKKCGVVPILEMWNSGGLWCAIRCNNPDRSDECDDKFYASMSHSPEETIKKWNELN